METTKTLEESVIAQEVIANVENYREAVEGLADVMMWMADGTIKCDEDIFESSIKSLALARGYLKLLIGVSKIPKP